MLPKFRLIAKALSFQVPPKLLIWGLLNTLNRSFRTGNRRFEFERLYLENPDPWNYRSSAYECQKYERTLSCALDWRRASESTLEVGCSVGVFSRMLAKHFDNVMAIDVSKEALRAAVDHNCAQTNITFVHAYLQSLDVGGRYDVIFCAEVLYYIADKYRQEVCRQLDRYLASDGIVLLVTGISTTKSSGFYFDGWEKVLADRFQRIFEQNVDDTSRPYRIVIFSRRH